ncbi:MAG: SurA N-terminal domain-containing protein, partial [Candidatus Omnitrophica bacterium]|nr:SurA N-terminal domain-containing protein [Candidatus Omnitrophota bacterium]
MAKKSFRKKIKLGGVILTLLILPTFIFWSSEVVLRSIKSNPYIGVVLGKKVSLDEFKESLEA